MAADVIGRDFTMVHNAALRDRRLSRRARGLLVEVLSHRAGFVISEAALVASGPEGRDAVRSALRELESYGYLNREQPRSGGRFSEAVFRLTDMPEGLGVEEPSPWTDFPSTEENSRSEPLTEKPSADSPSTENPLHKKTTSFKKTKEKKTNNTSAPSRDADPATARPDVERVCAHLADRIEANGSKRPTITKGWRTAARLLLDKDGRTEEQVHTAIDWCQDSEFWRANVLSLPKLRERYDQLRLQAQRQQPGGNVVPLRDRQQQASDDLFDRAMNRAHARMAATDPPPTNTTVADPLAATTNTTAAVDPLAPKEIAR